MVLKEFVLNKNLKDGEKPFKLNESEKAFNIRAFIEDFIYHADFNEYESSVTPENLEKFEEICLIIKDLLDKEDTEQIKEEKALERQRRALLGYSKEVALYKNKVAEIIQAQGYSRMWIPPWYTSPADAVYGEILGFSCISNWLSEEKYSKSVSCKIIGDLVYFKINGYLELQPQKIRSTRRELLKRTLLLINPKEPLDKAYHELYTATDHLRVTIFNSNGITKDGCDSIILRRYIVEDLTFEEQAKRGTIPFKSIPLIENMCKLGFNVCFNGPVESGKTTFLQSYQKLEDPRLEAVSIETDDETQYTKIMPGVPIIQFCPSPEEEDSTLDRLKRSDAAYIIVGEARNGKYLSLVVDAANMGTRRMKVTFHSTETVDFAYDVAEKICKDSGGLLIPNMIKVAKTFQFIFQLTSMPQERGKKRLKGIWAMEYDHDNIAIHMTQICKYVPTYKGVEEHWEWCDNIPESIREIGIENNPEAFEAFEATLKKLKEESPNLGKTMFDNPYLSVLGGRLN